MLVTASPSPGIATRLGGLGGEADNPVRHLEGLARGCSAQECQDEMKWCWRWAPGPGLRVNRLLPAGRQFSGWPAPTGH